MHIHIQARDFTLTESLRTYVEQRLRLGLGRFRDWGLRVSVGLSDVNGPKGGMDKRCHVQIRGGRLPDVVIQDTEEDIYVAINRAVARAARTLMRAQRRATRVVAQVTLV